MPVVVDKFKFNRTQQTSHCQRPLEKRGPLKLPKVLLKYDLSKKQIKEIKLKAASRASSTQSVHNRLLTQFEKFCERQGCNLLTFTEKTLRDYLIFLDDSNAKLCKISGLSGAITFICAAVRKHNYWTDSIDRLFEAILRRASSEKGLVRKAPKLQIDIFMKALRTHILPFKDDPEKIPLVIFRALFSQLLQYFLCARLSDLTKLKACDARCSILGDTPAFALTFRTSKTDPRYEGATSYLIFNGSEFCPYSIAVMYFNRCGIYTSDTSCLDSSFIFARTANGGNRTLIHDGRFKISNQTILRDVNKIYTNLGLDYKITTKSMKSLGVSTAFRIGMSDDHVRILGRWRSIVTAQHYREVDDSTLLKIFSRLLIKSNLPESDEMKFKPTLPYPSQLAISHSAIPAVQYHPHLSWASAHSPALNRELIVHLLISAGYVYPTGAPLMSDGYPRPVDPPVVETLGEDQLALEDARSYIVTLPN